MSDSVGERIIDDIFTALGGAVITAVPTAIVATCCHFWGADNGAEKATIWLLSAAVVVGVLIGGPCFERKIEEDNLAGHIISGIFVGFAGGLLLMCGLKYMPGIHEEYYSLQWCTGYDVMCLLGVLFALVWGGLFSKLIFSACLSTYVWAALSGYAPAILFLPAGWTPLLLLLVPILILTHRPIDKVLEKNVL